MADNTASTVVGPSILINGNLQGDEDLTVLGRVEGSISLTRTLHVEESGIVKADIQVRNAVVSGIVVGNITASDSVEITDAGRMVGDIRAPRVIIVDGARFRGAVDMGDLDAPRATGELPARTVSNSTNALTRSSGSSSSLPARRPIPSAPVRSSGGPVRPASTPARPAAPIQARPTTTDDTTIGGRNVPVLAGKKLKKKVVVRKKV
jgi:cytoskeletal protein CcmA (bactofilin family)